MIANKTIILGFYMQKAISTFKIFFMKMAETCASQEHS